MRNIFIRRPARVLLFLLVMGMMTAGSVTADLDWPELGKYGMTPISGNYIVDGTYDIEVESDSPYFKIAGAEVTVSKGTILAKIEIASHSYLYVYPGTAHEAEQKGTAEGIAAFEEGDSSFFTIPVAAFDTPVPCAAYSKRKYKWYDRMLLFDASTLPEEALIINLPDYDAIEAGVRLLEERAFSENESVAEISDRPEEAEMVTDQTEASDIEVRGKMEGDAYAPTEAVEVPYEDGEYSIEVSMVGGTGRTTISSPTLMLVRDGRAYAKILMSSSYYDWMISGGVTYENANHDGGSSYFIIPIPAMDTLVPVIADTTAMGEPTAIEYSLTFYSETIGSKGQIPQEAAKRVLMAAGVIVLILAVLNHLTKKKRRSIRK